MKRIVSNITVSLNIFMILRQYHEKNDDALLVIVILDNNVFFFEIDYYKFDYLLQISETYNLTTITIL